MHHNLRIGQSRDARRVYDLNDVQLAPARRTRSSKDVDTAWHVDAYTFDIPFVSHATDALGGPEFAAAFGAQGGLGVINAEGLLGRCHDLEAAREELLSGATESEQQLIARLRHFHSQPLDEELLASRIAELRATGETVAVRVTPQNARQLAPVVIKAGCEILFIQGTLISAEHVARSGEPLNLKEFIGRLDVPVIAGCVSDYQTATHLMRTGAAGIIVSSRVDSYFEDAVLGIGTGSATAISDVAAARRDYLDETGGRYVHILADDPCIMNSSDAIKAIACGADAVVLGSPLASAQEAFGAGAYWTHAAAHPELPRGAVQTSDEFGMLQRAVQEAGLQVDPVETARPTLADIVYGPAVTTDGTRNFAGALRRAMAKCGYSSIKQFQKVPLVVNS